MKTSKKLVTILCACLMVFSVSAGIVSVHNTNTYVAKAAAEQEANEIFKKKVRKYSTYSADVLDTYLTPIWNTDEVVDESCTVVGKTGFTRLLYVPVENSVVIRDYHNEKYYVENVDFKVNYETGEITRIETGVLPYFELDEYLSKTSLGFVQQGDGYTTFPVTNWSIGYDANSASRKLDSALGNTAGFNYISYYSDGQRLLHHFNVSYRVSSKDTWAEEYDANRTNRVTDINAAYTPTSQAGEYSAFLKKLQMKNEATVMFYGDSITFGCDATGHSSGGNVNPYLPRWSELVCDWLGREYGANITYLNGAIGGWTTVNGVDFWEDGVGTGFDYYVSSELGSVHKTYPKKYMQDNGTDSVDLLVLAFGMNDAVNGNITPAAYKTNIQTMINNYYDLNPSGSVLLMSHMMPNTQSTWYQGDGPWHQQVEAALYEVVNDAKNAGRAIAVAPVSSVFKTFEEKGKFTRNVLSNNINHPTDFAIRVYAQTVLQTLTGYASTTTVGGDIVSDNQIIIGTGASVRLNTMALDNGMTDSFMAGIRYRGYISTEYFDDIGGNPDDMEDVKLNSRYKVGMWMVAENVLTGTGLPFDHTLEENLQKIRPSANPWVYDVPVEIWDDRKDDEQIDGYVRFNAAMLHIPNTQFGTDLVARVYLCDTQDTSDTADDVYYVSRGMQNRNIAQVASMALAEETNFTPRQTQLLEWFIAGANNELANTFVYNDTTPTYDAPNAGIADNSPRVVLTRGDFLQFPITSSRLVPNVIVYNETKEKWVPISQLYGDLVSFNADTGILRVINNPKKFIEFNALVTLESAANLQKVGISDVAIMQTYKDFENWWKGWLAALQVTSIQEMTAEQVNDAYTCFHGYAIEHNVAAVLSYLEGLNQDANATAITKLTDAVAFMQRYANSHPVIEAFRDFDAWLTANEIKVVANMTDDEANAFLTAISNYATQHSVVAVSTYLDELSKGANATAVTKLSKAIAYIHRNANSVRRLQMVLFNSEFTLPANGYTFTTASSVQFPAPLAVDPSYNAFWYSYSVPAGTTITASTPNEAKYTDNVWTLTANSGNLLGKYTITVNTNSSWGGSHVIASKTFTIHVLTAKQSSTSIVSPSNQYADAFMGCGTGHTYPAMTLPWYCQTCDTMLSHIEVKTENDVTVCSMGHTVTAVDHDFLWYDDNEQAYHYQSINPMFANNVAMSVGGIPNADVIRFNPNSSVMAAYNNNAANYQYVLIDVKFAYNNGARVGDYTYDNTLAFWTLSKGSMTDSSSGVLWLSTTKGTTVNIFDADDTTARRLTHADIVAGNWYTIAVPASLMIQDGEEVFALFGGHYENDAQSDFVATDLYFRNIRFENVLGADFSENQDKLQFAGDENATDPIIKWMDTVNGTTGGAWKYYTATGINPVINSKDYSYAKYGVMPDGAFLTAYNDNASQYKYLAIDIMYENSAGTGAPDIFFHNGTNILVDGAYSETYVKDGRATGYVHRTYYANDLTKAYTSSTKAVNTWYTYIIPSPVAITDYLFGIYSYKPAAGEVTVYFKNIRFLNELIDSPLSGLTQSEADLPTDNQIMLSDMHVARNTTIESSDEYKANYSAIRTTYFQEGGYETNNEVPTPIKNTDSTYASNDSFVAPTQKWYTTGHKAHTSPQTIISRGASGANDWTVTQFRFTDYGYSYSDRILFNSPVHVSEISTISIRFYAVFSVKAAENKYWKKDNAGNLSILSPYPDYDTVYGGVRFFPYGKMDLSGFTGADTTDQGYMLPAAVEQGVWTTVTFPAEYLADSDGFVRGFWIGQSANAPNITEAQFIESSAYTDYSAYMNIDCVTATKGVEAYDSTSATTTEIAGATILSDMNTGIANALSKPDTKMVQTSTGFPGTMAPHFAFDSQPSDKAVIQYKFKTSNAVGASLWTSFYPVQFAMPVHVSAVSSLQMRMYIGQSAFKPYYIRFHAFGQKHGVDGYDANNRGWQIPLINDAVPHSWQTFTIDPSLLADPDDEYIRGFWVSMTGGENNAYIPDETYINVDYVSYVPKATYSAETGYKFTTAKGWGTYTYNTTTITETERFTFNDGEGAALSKIKTLMPSHKYITMDVRFEDNRKNNLVFAQGIPGVSETYYALQDGFNIDKQAVKRAYAYKKDEFGSAFKEPVEYKDMMTGVWYTVVMPIEYATYVTKDNYKLSVMTYAGDTTEETAGCEAWLNNLQLKATADLVVIGYDGNDLHKLDRFVSPNDSYATYDAGLKAYKLNANGYLGLTDETKMSIGKMSSYGRMTIDIYFAEGQKGNLTFWNGLGTGLGLKQEIKNNGEILAGATVDVYIAGTRIKVDYEDICENTWYTVELIAPQEDWAFIGSFEKEVYFRNVILHAGDIGETIESIPYSVLSEPFSTDWNYFE